MEGVPEKVKVWMFHGLCDFFVHSSRVDSDIDFGEHLETGLEGAEFWANLLDVLFSTFQVLQLFAFLVSPCLDCLEVSWYLPVVRLFSSQQEERLKKRDARLRGEARNAELHGQIR